MGVGGGGRPGTTLLRQQKNTQNTTLKELHQNKILSSSLTPFFLEKYGCWPAENLMLEKWMLLEELEKQMLQIRPGVSIPLYLTIFIARISCQELARGRHAKVSIRCEMWTGPATQRSGWLLPREGG